MTNIDGEHLAQNHIRAVFQTSAAFFDLPRAATFKDLADRLCDVADRHDGRSTSIEITAVPSCENRGTERSMMRHLIGMRDVPFR